MLVKWYACFDKKCGFYRNPFIAENDQSAVRVLGDALRDPQPSMVSAYPADFALYAVGEFDDNAGFFVVDSVFPKFIKEVSEYGFLHSVQSAPEALS